MKIDRLPIRLNAEPLVDALCEMRFQAAIPASGILPGVLFTQLGSDNLKLEALPASQIPAAVRHRDPMLNAAPLVRLLWGNFAIGIGEAAVAVSVIGKYPGWSDFKPAIIKVIGAVIGSGIVQRIDRYSVKYTDVIPLGSKQPVGGLDLKVSVGNHAVSSEAAQISVEILDDPYVHIVQAITNAEAVLPNGEKRSGSLVDVDSISTSIASDPHEFLKDLPQNLDQLHQKNKRIFFECLTQETLESLGPIYE